MKNLYTLLLIIFITVTCMAAKESSQAEDVILKIGDKAPDFKLQDDAGKWRTLSEFKGQYLVIYFYPKNDTPGCTKEACGFRDDYSGFEKEKVTVIGVSYDSVESHKNFKKKYNLPFILLSDHKKEVASAYGATRGMLKSLFPARITFLIDPEGKIARIFEDVSVAEHANDVLKQVQIFKNAIPVKPESED
ncbi:peroxiredoxin [candidate division KSB1 bacterium]|nr:peroxiredoxin [candidate division KSB1 bacterium]